jgi:hypothetical protein
VPHACEASSASRTIRSVDSAARRAGPEPAGLWPAATCHIPTQNAAAPPERRVPHACEASSASTTIRASTARPEGPVPNPPAFGRRRPVTSPPKTPPLPRSGGCHMLAKQAVLAEPSEASTARPKGPVPSAAPKRAIA